MFTPAVPRPAFLSQEEARMFREVTEKERLVEELREQQLRDQKDREEMRGFLDRLARENRELKGRLEALQKIEEGEPKFATPEEAADPPKEAVEPPEEAGDSQKEVKGRSKEAVGPQGIFSAYMQDTKEEEVFPWHRRSKEAEDPQKEAAGARSKEAERPPDAKGSEKTSSKDPTLEVILKLMEGMQEIQRQIVTNGSKQQIQDPEVVRHSADLPKLPEWSAETAPIDYNDWLLCLGPQMADLSPSSEEWWQVTVAAAREWYEQHQLLSPIARLTHHPQPTEEMAQQRWSRVERRASSLLMAAIPDQLREEVVASKAVNALAILAKGMQLYQPGGLAERSAILTSLESPPEAATIASAITTLRRWLRWKRRAEELKVGLPDPTILVRGLGKLVKKILQNMPDLSFRLSLVRNTLMIDTVPSHESVSRYSEHLLAELEQSGHQSKKKEVSVEARKLRKLEVTSKEEGGG